MSVIDNAVNGVKKLPRGVWIVSLAGGASLGVLFLIRNRKKVPDPGNTTDSTETTGALNSDQSVTPLSYGSSSGYGYAGDYGGGAVGGTGIAGDPSVNIGGGYVPLSALTDALGQLWGMGAPLVGGGAQGGTDSSGGSTYTPPANDVGTAIPNPTPPAPAAPQAVVPQVVSSAPQPTTSTNPCSGTAHPFLGPHGCYRVVLANGKRYHYYANGLKLEV